MHGLDDVTRFGTDECDLNALARATLARARRPPFGDPEDLAVAYGYEVEAWPTPHHPPPPPRVVSYQWHADRRVRGWRVLLAFAAALLRERGEPPVPARVNRLAGLLLVPRTNLAAARARPALAATHAPMSVVRQCLRERGPDIYAVVCF